MKEGLEKRHGEFALQTCWSSSGKTLNEIEHNPSTHHPGLLFRTSFFHAGWKYAHRLEQGHRYEPYYSVRMSLDGQCPHLLRFARHRRRANAAEDFAGKVIKDSLVTLTVILSASRLAAHATFLTPLNGTGPASYPTLELF